MIILVPVYTGYIRILFFFFFANTITETAKRDASIWIHQLYYI